MLFRSLPPIDGPISTTDLMATRAIALQKRPEDLARLHSKVYAARVRAAQRFEIEHRATIRDFDFKRGDVVILRNTRIEKALNRKMLPRYTGPLFVVARNRGGAYILCEVDGAVMDRPVAAFRVLPYFARHHIPLPENFGEITPERLREMVESSSQGDDEDEARYADLEDEADEADDRDYLPDE